MGNKHHILSSCDVMNRHCRRGTEKVRCTCRQAGKEVNKLIPGIRNTRLHEEKEMEMTNSGKEPHLRRRLGKLMAGVSFDMLDVKYLIVCLVRLWLQTR